MATKFEGLDNDQITATTTIETLETTEQPKQERTPTDSSKITVQVTDKNVPIILLFGAQASGKTMTLVRLADYLQKRGFKISVDPLFVNRTEVWEYGESTDNFNTMLGTRIALPGTDYNDFLFIKVCDNQGTLICQILEGAGEDYFPKNGGQNRVAKPFPSYMTTVFNSGNKKVWIFITEPNWSVSQSEKNDYVRRIDYCKSQYINLAMDKSIILYNKVDQTAFGIGKGVVNVENAWNACNNEYPGLFNIFRNTSPLPWTAKYTCKFVPFSTGSYGVPNKTNEVPYTASADAYPERLWKTIMECIKPSLFGW